MDSSRMGQHRSGSNRMGQHRSGSNRIGSGQAAVVVIVGMWEVWCFG